MHRGWHQVAFERELQEPLVPTRIGKLDLMLVRREEGVTAYDAACPHRGAHLAHGGRLEGDHVVCPFHGYSIGLGEEASCSFRIRGYRTLAVGGLVFVLLDERYDHGFAALMERLDASHFFVQGFALSTRATPELVIENGFDAAHFSSVHGLAHPPELTLGEGTNGEMAIEGLFEAPSEVAGWGEERAPTAHGGLGVRIGFTAQIFSPSLCVTRLDTDNDEYRVVSGAVPNGDGSTTVRVSVIASPGPDGAPPATGPIRQLLRDSRLAYEQDLVIWDHLVDGASTQYVAGDRLILQFHDFCRRFGEERPT